MKAAIARKGGTRLLLLPMMNSPTHISRSEINFLIK